MNQPESSVSQHCQTLLYGMGAFVYSTESGYLVETDAAGNVRPRKGGTRTTPGIPDTFCMFPVPVAPDLHFWTVLTVEMKGTKTPIKKEQWLYALRAQWTGQAHLIVRSADAMLTGLAYMGLLPKRYDLYGSNVWDRTVWPENMNYLSLQAVRFWSNYGLLDRMAHMEAYGRDDKIPKNRKHEPKLSDIAQLGRLPEVRRP